MQAATVAPDNSPSPGSLPGPGPAVELGDDFEAELRIEQSIHLVSQLPTLVIGNNIGVLIGFLLTAGYESWPKLALWFVITALTIPMALNWIKLRNKPRPPRVSRRRMRAAAWYSLALGLCWLAAMPIFLPNLPMVNQMAFLLGLSVLCAGAVASISALPLSAIAYFVPMMSGIFLISAYFGEMPNRPVAVLTGLLFISLPAFLQQNWNTFRRNVAVAVERTRLAEMQRQEVARRAAAEAELRAAKDAAEAAADEVRRAQRRVQSIIEALPLPVAVFRLSDGQTVYANRWAAELLGLDLKQMLKRNRTEFLRDADEVHRVVRLLREGAPVVDYETQITRSDGEPVPVRLSAILMDYGGDASILTVTEDITLRKQNEQQIELARQRAEEANSAKSRFLANMSHELRTPLNAVLGYAELMADGIYGALPEKAASVLSRIQTNGRHLLGLINDVLDLSKIEAGEVDLHFEPYSWETIVHSVVSATESLAQAKSLDLRVEIAPGLPAGLGDERRLTQVLLNLVGNAIKFTDDGHVAVGVAARDGRFVVTVADTGPGIPLGHQARIFDEFQQVDDASTRKKGGTGLGLAISNRLVSMHGGTLSVESAPGEGALFTISVPVRAAAPQTQNKEPA